MAALAAVPRLEAFSPESFAPIISFLLPNDRPSSYPFESDFLPACEGVRTTLSLRVLSKRVRSDWDSVVPTSLITYVNHCLGAEVKDGASAMKILKECFAVAESADVDLNYSINHKLCEGYRDLKRKLLSLPALKPMLNTYILQGGIQSDEPVRGFWSLETDMAKGEFELVTDPPFSKKVSADVDVFQRLNWLKEDPYQYVPYPLSPPPGEDHPSFYPDKELICRYDDLSAEMVGDLSPEHQKALRKSIQDLTTFRAFFALQKDFATESVEVKQLINSGRYAGFFGNWSVYNRVEFFHLMPFLRIHRSNETYFATISLCFKSGAPTRVRRLSVALVSLDGAFKSGSVYRLDCFGNDSDDMLFPIPTDMYPGWIGKGVEGATNPGWIGKGVEEAPSLFHFISKLLNSVGSGQIRCTDLDWMGGPENKFACGPDLFSLCSFLPVETSGINVEANYIQYDEHESHCEVGYAYGFKIWTEGLTEDVVLESRHFKFEEEGGYVNSVDGGGVIGLYPTLHPDGSYSLNGEHYPRDVHGPFSYQSCTGSLGVVKMSGHLRFKTRTTLKTVDAQMRPLEFVNHSAPVFPIKAGEGRKMWSKN